MNLQSRSYNRVTVLEIDGRVDTSTVSNLRNHLHETVHACQPYLVIDLTNVSFMDSSGLAVLIQGLRQCRESGGDLCLCNPQQPVRMVLELTRLDKAIEIFPGAAEAIEALTG